MSQTLGWMPGPRPIIDVPSGASLAVIAHPRNCRVDEYNMTPCVANDRVRWLYDMVSGTWSEQATESQRPFLRASGGKWYLERANGSGGGSIILPAITRPAEFCASVKSPSATWSTYGGALNGYESLASRRWALFESGNTTFHSNPYPASMWRDGVSVASPFDIAPITDWMNLNIRVGAGADATGGTLLMSYDNLADGCNMYLSAAATFTSTRTTEQQAADRAWLAKYTP